MPVQIGHIGTVPCETHYRIYSTVTILTSILIFAVILLSVALTTMNPSRALQRENMSLKLDLTLAQSRRDRHEKTATELASKVSDAENAFRQADEQNKVLHAQVKRFLDELNTGNEQIEQFDLRITAWEEELARVEVLRTEACERGTALRAELDMANTNREALAEHLREANDNAKRLSDRNLQLNGELETSRKFLDKMREMCLAAGRLTIADVMKD